MHADTADVLRVSERPLPAPDAVSAPYWAAAARGELHLQRCRSCGKAQHYPRPICRHCAGEVDFFAASGQGVVHTFTVVRTHFSEPFKSLTPFVLAVIELAEGPLMMGNVVGCDPETVHIGLPVTVTMAPVDDELAIPFWKPAAA